MGMKKFDQELAKLGAQVMEMGGLLDAMLAIGHTVADLVNQVRQQAANLDHVAIGGA